MRKKIVAGNWKMNKTLSEGLELVSSIREKVSASAFSCELIISPSFTSLRSVTDALAGTRIKTAAQNCAAEESGAFTGEVSAAMIRSCGAEYVILGHSERRILFSETNALLLKKVKIAFANELIPIYCLGETLAERKAKKHFDTAQKQLQDVVFRLTADQVKRMLIAYEPIWAIGTGKTATPVQAQEMHQYIRTLLEKKMGKEVSGAVRILYGGSCNVQNATELFSLPDVDGGLIGGASLKAEDFISIAKSAG